jgi:hypothetical protein
VDGEFLVIETKAKEAKVLKLTPETVYLKSGNTARLQDLKVGDRVLIHYKQTHNEWIVLEVIFGPTKKQPAKKAS